MKVAKGIQHVTFRGEDGDELRVGFDNRGDPYREGVTLTLSNGYETQVHLFLEEREVIHLRDLLLNLYPVTK
jgi:hypothetical protein